VPRIALARNVAAFVVIVVACPASLFVTVALGCAALGYTGRCALDSALLSPVVLLAAGFVAGLLTRGWTGLAIVVSGVIAGMFVLLFVAAALGNPVPIDPISATIGAIWFMVPVLFSYGIGRGVMRLIGWALKPADAATADPAPTEVRPG
jgi:hypothetical protein